MAYSDGEKAEALIRLAVNRYDFDKTAKELNLPVMTLRRWNKNVPKNGIADMLERAIEHLLAQIPKDLHGTDWAVTLGILMDKWLLTQNKATARTDHTVRALGLSQDEFDDVLAEANRIIEAATGGGDSPGDRGTED